MKVYTKTGDTGETGLFGGGRVSKDDTRIEAYGTVDELNAFLGQARCQSLPTDLDEFVELLQNELFAVGAELATPDAASKQMAIIDDGNVARLESEIDRLEETLQPLQQFILPAGCAAATCLHVARSACRRAERRVVTLAREDNVRGEVIRYLNRLSDLLFVMSRAANQRVGCADVPWQKP